MVIFSPLFHQLHWLRHGFTTRRGGHSAVYGYPNDLNLGYTVHDDPALVRRNRALLPAAIGLDPGTPLVTVRQVHRNAVLTAVSAHLPREAGLTSIGDADALITAEPGLLLGIQAADCVPILLADTRRRVVAAVHAGWRGTAAGIVQAAVARMSSQYGSHPADLVAAIGPSIGPCCYAVGEEVRTAFRATFGNVEDLFNETSAGLHLNLWQANQSLLLAAGLHPAGIWTAEECTACTFLSGRRKYFSHRAERGVTGRAMGLIAIVSSPSPRPPP